MTVSNGTGWLRNTYADKVDIVPRGEEDMHIPFQHCECRPKIEELADGKLMICHNSYDRREEFEQAAQQLSGSYRGRLAA